MSKRPHWSAEFDGYTMLNSQHKHSNLFSGIEPKKSIADMLESSSVGSYAFNNKAQAEEATLRINELLKSKGFSEKAEIVEYDNGPLFEVLENPFHVTLENACRGRYSLGHKNWTHRLPRCDDGEILGGLPTELKLVKRVHHV